MDGVAIEPPIPSLTFLGGIKAIESADDKVISQKDSVSPIREDAKIIETKIQNSSKEKGLRR